MLLLPSGWHSAKRSFREHKKLCHKIISASQLVLKGTTTIGVVCKDGVILASDTRVTMGFYVAHKFGKKVYKIDDHLGMTIAGTVADAQRVVDILIANAQLYKINLNRPMPVSAAARLVANLLFSARYVPLATQVLVGGIDETGPHVYNLDPYGSLTGGKIGFNRLGFTHCLRYT